MSERFFTIAAKLLESPLWLDEVFTRGQAWIDLIGLANFSAGFTRVRGVRVDVDRGMVAMSQTQLSARWHWSRKKVDSYLKELEIAQQIAQQKNNVTTLIINKNYDEYQLGAPQKAPQKHRRSTAEAPQSDFTFISRIKEEERENRTKGEALSKKITAATKELQNPLPPFIDPSIWADFKQLRKEIKKPLTPTAEKMAIKKLSDLNSENYDCNRIVLRSIENSWQGLFPKDEDRRSACQLIQKKTQDQIIEELTS